MKELIEILKEIKPEVDFEKEKNLISDGILDSFDIVTLVSEINDKFDIEFPVTEVVPENFENVDALYKTIQELKND
ncbi:MAG: phosphopantetheine-binding protein [bacterium]|nr:phosphopantetheine-binding protein [bacterium]